MSEGGANMRPEIMRSIATPSREGRTGVLKAPPPPPTAPPRDRIPSSEPKKGMSTKGKVASTLAGVAVGVAMAPTVEHYAEHPEDFNPQAIVRDVSSFPGTAWNRALTGAEALAKPFASWLPKAEAAPSTFDPAATRGLIGVNNSVKMSQEEYEAVAPPEVGENKVNTPWIFKSPEGAPSIIYKLTRPFMGIKRTVITETGDKKEVDVYDSVEFKNIAPGTQLISRWDGEISQEGIKAKVNQDGTQKYFSAQITTHDENSNPYTVNLATAKIKLHVEIPNTETVLVPGTTSTYTSERHSIQIKKNQVLGTIESTDSIPNASTDAQVVLRVTDSKGVTNVGFASTPEGKIIDIQ